VSDLTLFKITDNLPALIDTRDMVDDGTPEAAEIDAQITEYMRALPSKVDGVSHVLATFDAMEDAIDAEIKRLRDLKATAERRKYRLEQYVVAVMQNLPEPHKGPRRITGRTSELVLRKNPPSVVISDESALRDVFVDVTVKMPAVDWSYMQHHVPAEVMDSITVLSEQRIPKKADIKVALQAQRDVDGAYLSEDNYRIERK
jgi:hypothetical protein